MELPLEINPLTLEFVGKGSQGTVYRIDSSHCIKIYFQKNICHDELKGFLKGGKSFFFPKVFDWSDSYIIREYIIGEPITRYLLIHPLDAVLSSQLLHILKDLRRFNFNSPDFSLYDILITNEKKLKLIDTIKIENHRRAYPKILLSDLANLGLKEVFLNLVQQIDPTGYYTWDLKRLNTKTLPMHH